MELVAGPAEEILTVVAADDRAGLAGGRFPAYLSLSGGMDPTWLDLFAEAARAATELDVPPDLIDARIELGPPPDGSALTVERVDPAWITAVAAIPDAVLDRVAGRWIDRLEEEFGDLPGEEKPWIRELAGRVVAFCRSADRATDRAPDVVFVWGL